MLLASFWQKDGSPARWLQVTEDKRRSLGLENRDAKPWTSRPEVRLRGFSRQLVSPNFLHELVDVRLMAAFKAAGIPVTSTTDLPPKGLLVDGRQDSKFQNATGSVSLLSGSRVYMYDKDRCAIGHEHMQFNGWSLADVDMASVVEPIRAEIEASLSGTAAKKRRGKAPEVGNTLVDVAGNGQSLPDLALIAVPLMYLLNGIGLFAADISMEEVMGCFDQAHAVPSTAHSVVMDPNNQAAIRALRRSADPGLGALSDDDMD